MGILIGVFSVAVFGIGGFIGFPIYVSLLEF